MNCLAILSCLYEFDWPLAYFSMSCLIFWLAILEKYAQKMASGQLLFHTLHFMRAVLYHAGTAK